MRVTQSMLQNNMLNNLFKSQSMMDKYLTQINTGKKISRPSEDPVVAMKGMNFRTQVTEIEQYRRNASEIHNWMDNSDDALDKGTKVMQRLEYLAVQAANGTYSEDERGAILEEVNQLKEQMMEIANTNVNGKYIFNGTDTNHPPFEMDENGKVIEKERDGSGNDLTRRNQPINIEVSKGINFEVNVDPKIFDGVFGKIDNFIKALGTEFDEAENQQDLLDKSIEDLQAGSLQIINGRAELGARMNRLDLIEDRLEQQNIIAEDTMAKNEGVDFEEAVMNLLTQEVIHRAALAAGSKIIQPSLVDFLR